MASRVSRRRLSGNKRSRFPSYLDQIVEVVILQIANPCQYFSKAHSIRSKNDEADIETVMVIGDYPDKLKLRIVTLEDIDDLSARGEGIESDPPVGECLDKIQ